MLLRIAPLGGAGQGFFSSEYHAPPLRILWRARISSGASIRKVSITEFLPCLLGSVHSLGVIWASAG